MAKVYAQIIVDLELDERTVSGTFLDLMGLSGEIKNHLEALPSKPTMRVVEVGSPIKGWEISNQLQYGEEF